MKYPIDLLLIILLASSSARCQDTAVVRGAAKDTPRKGSCRIGFGLGSPAFTRGDLIIPNVPLDVTATGTWQNAFSNLGGYPIAFIGEVIHDRPSGVSYVLGGSYAPSRLRAGAPVVEDKTSIAAYRCYGKVLWRPSWLLLSSGVRASWSRAEDWSLRGVLGVLLASKWNTLDVEGKYDWGYGQHDWTASLHGVAGLYLGNHDFSWGLESELLMVSHTQDDWQRSFFISDRVYKGANSKWLDPLEAIDRNYFLQTITLRAIWAIGQRK